MKRTVNTAVLKTLTWAFLICLGGLFSCKKEEVRAPDVTIFQPAANSAYSFGDTIFVEASISHPNLERANLTLTNAIFSAVEPIQSFSANGSSISISSYIVIQNKRIETGAYNVRIQSIAAGESFNTFIPIQITGVAKSLRATYVATSDSLSRSLYRIENGQNQLSRQMAGDYSGIATNSFYDGVFMAPNYLGDLNLFRPLTDSLIWIDANNASGGAAFMTGLYNTNEEVYGFYRNGQVVRYGNNGLYVQSYLLPPNTIAIDALQLGESLLIVGQQIGGVGHSLFYYNQSTANLIRTVQLLDNSAHVALLPYQSNAVAVFYNNPQNEGVLKVYSQTGAEINVPSLPNLSIFAAEQVGSEAYALGTNQGTVLFRTNATGLPALSTIPAQILAFDELQSDLYLATGNSVWIYQYPSMVLKTSYSYPQPVKGISFLYNK